MIKLARSLLLIQGLMCLIYGVVVALNLNHMAEYMGLAIAHDNGRAEIITMYLGMSGVLGLFMSYSGVRGKYIYEALLIMLLTMTGITFGRCAGFIIFNTDEYILHSLLYDIPILLLTGWCFFSLFSGRQGIGEPQ